MMKSQNIKDNNAILQNLVDGKIDKRLVNAKILAQFIEAEIKTVSIDRIGTRTLIKVLMPS